MNSNENHNEDLVIWTFDFALTTFYEIDTELIQTLLPERLSPIEVVPGISLINVTAFNFKAGALGTLPEFQELIFTAVVTPDLTRGVPKFAMYVISLGSTCQDHLDHSADYYKLPVYDKISHAVIKKDDLIVEYADSQGSIINMNNCSDEVNFKDDERYFQSFTHKDGVTYIADLYLKASLYEHQQSGDVGVLYNHPFFLDLNLKDAEPVVYLQMISEPGKPGYQYYHRPEIF